MGRNIIKQILGWGWKGIQLWDVLLSLGVISMIRAALQTIVGGWHWWDQLFLFGGLVLVLIVFVPILFPKIREWFNEDDDITTDKGRKRCGSKQELDKNRLEQAKLMEQQSNEIETLQMDKRALTLNLNERLKQVDDLQKKLEEKSNVANYIPTRRQALEDTRVAWALWHTGMQHRVDKLFELPSLKKILVLEPNIDNPAIAEVAAKSKDNPNNIIAEINATIDEALLNKKDIRIYKEGRDYSFVIYDPEAVEINGELYPCSRKAWVYMEHLTPGLGADQRRGDIFKNEGKSAKEFMGYYKEYERIWLTRSKKPDIG